MTFSTKVVFPVIWISGFGLVSLLLWLGDLRGRDNLPPPEQLKLIFLAVWIFGTVFVLWLCTGLKRVRIDSRRLYVSNYLREVTLPFDDIIDVTQNRWINIRPVTIHLRNATMFGDQITFMPKRELLFWKKSPVVAELKALAGLEHDTRSA
jgi:hypothetical protein